MSSSSNNGSRAPANPGQQPSGPARQPQVNTGDSNSGVDGGRGKAQSTVSGQAGSSPRSESGAADSMEASNKPDTMNDLAGTMHGYTSP